MTTEPQRLIRICLSSTAGKTPHARGEESAGETLNYPPIRRLISPAK